MPKAKTKYTEIEDIKDDLNSLRTNVVELTRHLKKETGAQSQEIKSMAIDKLSDLKMTGQEQMKNVERRVKAKPSQSLAIAFGAGIIASLLLKRR